MDHAAFQSWLDRYIDAWRLLDPVAIGDLFSSDVRYAYDPFEEAVVGRKAVVDSWLADPGRTGLLGGRLRGPRDRWRRACRPRPDPLPDRRPLGHRPRIRERLRLPLRRRGPLSRIHRVVHATTAGGAAGLRAPWRRCGGRRRIGMRVMLDFGRWRQLRFRMPMGGISGSRRREERASGAVDCRWAQRAARTGRPDTRCAMPPIRHRQTDPSRADALRSSGHKPSMARAEAEQAPARREPTSAP